MKTDIRFLGCLLLFWAALCAGCSMIKGLGEDLYRASSWTHSKLQEMTDDDQITGPGQNAPYVENK